MWFILPALVINVAIILVPAILTIAVSMTHWNGLGVPLWAGLDNFVALFRSADFYASFANNLKWTAIFLTIPIGMGLIAAALLLQVRRGRTFFQVVFYLPAVIATVVVARVWQGMIYNPQAGIVAMLRRAGVQVVDPLAHPATSLYAVAAADLWHFWGFVAVIFFAALRQVSREQIESALIDGAGFFQLLRFVLIPAIRPTITLILILVVIWSFLAFDFVFVLTQGGPGNSSSLLSTLAFRQAFSTFDVGGAAATSLVISAFGLVAAVFYVRLQQRELES